jgi:hypothetical protein
VIGAVHEPQYFVHIVCGYFPLIPVVDCFAAIADFFTVIKKLVKAYRLGCLIDLPGFPAFGQVLQIGVHFLLGDGVLWLFVEKTIKPGHPMKIEIHRFGTGDVHCQEIGFEILHAPGNRQKPYQQIEIVISDGYYILYRPLALFPVHCALNFVQGCHVVGLRNAGSQ